MQFIEFFDILSDFHSPTLRVVIDVVVEICFWFNFYFPLTHNNLHAAQKKGKGK